jgi:protein-serine/threonine kinase
MAPELIGEWAKDADPHSLLQPKEISYGNEVDIWAYACTIYEMACGHGPHHKLGPFDLSTAGAPVLEGDRFSQELKDFLAFVFQPDPHDRPTPDQILEHPYLADSTKLYPTVTLVKLVEEYYMWEQQGGARQSLFNPYGAQAPDPLAPEPEDEDDDDWSFSTSEEFEQEHAPQFADPFAGGAGQTFNGMNIPPVADMGRFEQLQARFKEESIVRGQTRLNKLFDTSTTPYRYSAVDLPDPPNGRPPSDLVLRDFNPGAPNRETVIDLDFSMPSADEIPSIDLGDVPTIRANRMKSIIREMEEEEERQDTLNEEDQMTKRATKDWTFPSNTDDNRKTMEWSFPAEQPNRKTMEWSFAAEQPPPNRKTMEWSFPAQPAKPNRRTVEWTFDAAMAEANHEAPRNRTSNRMSRRRETKEWAFPKQTDTHDFAFPIGSPEASKHTKAGSSSPLAPGFRPSLRHSKTAPLVLQDENEYPEMISSASNSPLRSSMIDLDMAMVEDYRPSTSGSEILTGSMNENPFNLEDQVQLSQNNHRASFHMKSQSEPNHAVPGLLTPQQYDEQGQPMNDQRSMHARGVSSASQVKGHVKPPINKDIVGGHKGNQRSQQIIWDGWSHTTAYGLNSDDQSPPMSVTTDTSLEEEDVDELWETFERLNLRKQMSYAPLRSARRMDSTSTLTLDSDTDDSYHPYSSSSDFDHDIPPSQSFRKSTLSVGQNGKPLVDFPVPHGPDVSNLLGADIDVKVMQDILLKSVLALRDGTRASRDLLRAMRLQDVEEGGGEPDEETQVNTVRLRGV